MRRWLFLIIGFLVSAYFIYLSFQGLKLEEVWQEITHANLWWLVPGVVIYFFAVWGRTWRWHYLLRPLQEVPLSKLFPIVVIGYMGNNVYPFRAGEVIRAYVLKRNHDVKITASLATIIVERIFDGLVMLLFVFVALPFANFKEDWLRSVVAVGTIAFFGALAVFFFMATRPVLARRLYHNILSRVLPAKIGAAVIRMADHFMEGLESLRSPRDLFWIMVSSIFIWLTETTKYWFVTHAFNFEVSFFTLMIMTAVVNLATTLPAAPGYVGTFDGPGIAVLVAYGVDPKIAASYTLVLHAALWLPITVLGFYYLAKQGLSWRSFGVATEIVESEKKSEHETTHTADGVEPKLEGAI